MTRRTGLGRGLDALIPGGEVTSEGGVFFLPVERIQPNPRQPRAAIDPEELAELSASIREHGVLQPLIVTPGEHADEYILIAGERRLQAARQAGLRRVPAMIRSADEQQRLELALKENVKRTDLNALEAAEAYRQLAEDFHLSHEEIARRVSKSRVAVTNTMRLLRLPEDVRRSLAEGLISEGHARVLLTLPSSQAQSAANQMILARGLNVRQTEELVRRMISQRTSPQKHPPHQSPEIGDLEERLRSALGTRVSIRRSRKGGAVMIHFYSEEELNALIEYLLGKGAD